MPNGSAIARRETVVLAEYHDGEASWEMQMRQAQVLLDSGFLPEAYKKPAQVVAVLQAGRELGLKPMQSIRYLNVIHGSVSVSAEYMLAAIRASGMVHRIAIESERDHCTIRGDRDGETTGVTFDEEDAKAAGLAGTAMWKKYPRAMYRSRAISEWARLIAPDVTGQLYTPEELEHPVTMDAEGNIVVDVDAEPVGPPTGRQKITGRPAVVEPDPVPEPEPVSELDQKAKAAANRKAHALASELWGPAGHLALRIHVAQASQGAVKKWSDADEASRNKVLAHVESVAETGTDETCKACQCADLAAECEKYEGGLKAAEVVVAKSTGGQSLFEQLFTLSQELAAVEPPNEGENSVP